MPCALDRPYTRRFAAEASPVTWKIRISLVPLGGGRTRSWICRDVRVVMCLTEVEML